MRIQKLLSAFTAFCLASTAMISVPMTQASAADETLTFDIQCAGSNTITLGPDALTESDMVMPISIYVTENPGVNAISLKLQINDGEEAEDGSLGNYGFTMTDGAYGAPYCFDSVNEGDSAMAFSSLFTSERMNIGWIYSTDQTVNADAYAEAGTTAWDDTVSWVYDYAFVTANLVIPQGTPAGTYVLDIRREKYVNALSTETNVFYSQSLCKGAGVDGGLEYASVPLTIVVEDAEETTTTTTETTTTETTTTETTTTETTLDTTTTYSQVTTTESTATETSTTSTEIVPTETFPAEVLPDGSDAYADLLAGDDYTFIYGNVSGAPGSTVKMPIYIYNDTGTAGAMFYIDYDSSLTPVSITNGGAYRISMEVNTATNPLAAIWASGNGQNLTAKNGSVFVYLEFTIPEDAVAGTTYEVNTCLVVNEEKSTKVADTDGLAIDVKYVGGTVTVVSDTAEDAPVMNYTDYSFATIGDSVTLELLNAAEGEVAWYTSDPEVASVTACGNMAQVTAIGSGSCQIIATYNGVNYVCNVRSGLFGDINSNGAVDSEDAILALSEYAASLIGSTILTDAERQTADVTGDSAVDSSDAIALLQYYVNTSILGKDTSWYELTGNPNAPDAP